MVWEGVALDKVGKRACGQHELADLDVHAVGMRDRRTGDVHPGTVGELGTHDRVRPVDTPTRPDEQLVGHPPDRLGIDDDVGQLLHTVPHDERPHPPDDDDLLDERIVQQLGEESVSRGSLGQGHDSRPTRARERVNTRSGGFPPAEFRLTR